MENLHRSLFCSEELHLADRQECLSYCIIHGHRLECPRTIVVLLQVSCPQPMNLKQVFINPVGRLRSGWRVLIFAFVYVCLLFLLSTAARLVYTIALHVAPGRSLGAYFENVVFRLILLLASLGAGYICTRWLEGLPWRALGLWPHEGWLRDLLVGSFIGVASLAVAAGIATAGGGLSFTVSGRAALLQVFQTLIFSAVLFIIAALAEEALFRGYPLQTSDESTPRLARGAADVSSFCGSPSEKPECSGGLHLHQYRAGGSVARRRLSAHAELVVSFGSSLGLELGAGIAFWSAGQRHNRPRAAPATPRHRLRPSVVDRRKLWHRRRTRLHDYADSLNDIHLAHAAGFRNSRDEAADLAGKPVVASMSDKACCLRFDLETGKPKFVGLLTLFPSLPS